MHWAKFFLQKKLAYGVNVVISIFGDCRQSSAKNMAFFLKTKVMINILQKLVVH
jgi:hypothetical protein